MMLREPNASDAQGLGGALSHYAATAALRSACARAGSRRLPVTYPQIHGLSPRRLRKPIRLRFALPLVLLRGLRSPFGAFAALRRRRSSRLLVKPTLPVANARAALVFPRNRGSPLVSRGLHEPFGLVPLQFLGGLTQITDVSSEAGCSHRSRAIYRAGKRFIAHESDLSRGKRASFNVR